ncbi:GGDEF domain-containing protein [Amycolatopsis roodepoortensis]|uniref:GGDEF domain-containing protein n=1 Tax=Amycolatopsis roodepoortensis TaxID=700274 RepID=UPI000F8918DB|nr:GGDEF domain-containing protein [Amycolatopsis roodepoortensis]RSN09049.1 GGDEF domain-containing protein [Streptomyces sp. WAC 05977]UUV29191.1 GGDEF domain-containing protein [Amycolatopsis roodepoortensis]
MRLTEDATTSGRRPALAEMSDAWLYGRARELGAAIQRVSFAEQLDIVTSLDELLDETQRRGEPLLVAQLLRYSAMARLVTRGLAAEAEPRLDEMLAHTRRHGLALMRADAHAMRGRRLVIAKQEDAALTEIARALAILDDSAVPDRQVGRRNWDRMLSTTLVDCWLVLNQLGVYEAAEEAIARAAQAIRDSASPHEIALQLINRVKMLLGWGLRLERIERYDEGADKFRTAASMAQAAEGPFTESLFPRKAGVPAIDQVGVLAAAAALASPDSSHIERLNSLLHPELVFPHEREIIAIALARCLDNDGRREDALQVLKEVREDNEDGSLPSMRLNLARELARLDTTPDYASGASQSLIDYATILETEMWSLRESQIATLNARREHERLSAEHGAITQQALQDPLTGLPNRRALDEKLRSLASSADAQPLAVALVDLDGFKDVNDKQSHAEGDNVLRVIASTLRDALRGDDVVARYGGDEFIVLLPGAPASAAKQALGRSVNAVASLPHHLSHGVTLSVGLVSLRPQERAEQVLARADAAMYQAKRGGGNQVSSVNSMAIDPATGWPGEDAPTDPAWDAEQPT